MSYEVDTDEIRRVVREVRNLAQSVRQLSSQNVRNMQNSVADSLEGEAADALSTVLEELSGDIIRISSGLDSVQKTLLEYAKRVEEADRRAKEAIQGG